MKANNSSEQEILERLAKTINNLLQTSRMKDLRNRTEIELTTDIYDDLGIDSLELMDLLAAVEKEFGAPLGPEVMASKRKINDIVIHLKQTLGERP